MHVHIRTHTKHVHTCMPLNLTVFNSDLPVHLKDTILGPCISKFLKSLTKNMCYQTPCDSKSLVHLLIWKLYSILNTLEQVMFPLIPFYVFPTYPKT